MEEHWKACRHEGAEVWRSEVMESFEGEEEILVVNAVLEGDS